jgi:hypothetical protein
MSQFSLPSPMIYHLKLTGRVISHEVNRTRLVPITITSKTEQFLDTFNRQLSVVLKGSESGIDLFVSGAFPQNRGFGFDFESSV